MITTMAWKRTYDLAERLKTSFSDERDLVDAEGVYYLMIVDQHESTETHFDDYEVQNDKFVFMNITFHEKNGLNYLRFSIYHK